MEFIAIEDQQDACAISIAAPAAESLREISRAARKPSDEQTSGEENEPEKIQFTQKSVSNCWDEEYQPRLTIEEILTISSKDSRNVVAFKSVMNELLCRQNCSRKMTARYSTLGKGSPDASLPSLGDFSADCLLAGKRALTPNLYRVLCWAVETVFERWMSVPLGVRRTIEERTGGELLRRSIFNGRNTHNYWYVGRKQRPQTATNQR
ncbi:MAG TPA: hypothetical protein VHA06_00425 [Candidatus Angelobacter sp.]|jgi:hypothetical protein|nr:hypothetical protein [Candidatus Angelobacter sp.]